VGAQRVVVVGAGLGGLRTAEALRASGYADELVVVGDETHPPYNRPPLSKEALAAGVDREQLEFRRRPSVDDVEWLLGSRVESIDLDARTAVAAGRELAWDALVLATGVTARRLVLPGPAQGRHVVRTLDDARALRGLLGPGTRLAVLGAGFIGCEVAATATGLGADVAVAAFDVAPMIRPLGPVVGAELRRRHEAHGVRFHLGTGIAALSGTDRVEAVELADGTVLPADVVVEAVGSSPSVGLLADQGLDTTDGILVDSALRPMRADGPLDGVAVVGDVARLPYPRFGGDAHRVEHWNLPTETGRRAGAVLAAYLAGTAYDEVLAAPFDPLPAFWSDQYDIRMQSFGLPGLADPHGVRVLEGDLAGDCVVGYHRGEDLMGVVALGLLREAMAYRDRLGVARA
jgi:NADPH-dependent 2,4-dienoyl-CoA reductase/sulfur reductase-like enzyme